MKKEIELRQWCLGNVDYSQPLQIRMHEANQLFDWVMSGSLVNEKTLTNSKKK